jgi:hypothetical protein
MRKHQSSHQEYGLGGNQKFECGRRKLDVVIWTHIEVSEGTCPHSKFKLSKVIRKFPPYKSFKIWIVPKDSPHSKSCLCLPLATRDGIVRQQYTELSGVIGPLQTGC